MRTNTTNNENLATQPAASPAQTTTTVQQPAQQPPVVVQQPAPANGTTNRTVVVKVPDDAAIQAEVDRRIANAAALSRLGLTTTVSGGKVVLVGRVSDRTLRAQAERLARGVTGVKTIDNQIIVVTRQP